MAEQREHRPTGVTTPTPEPFFHQRLPFLRLLSEERRDQLRLMFEGYFRSIEHFQQVMVLAAGIAGVVVPILYSQGPAFANPWFLRRAVVSFGLCIASGIVSLFVGRWLMVYMSMAIQSHFGSQNDLVGAAETEAEIGAAMASANEQWAPKGKRLTRMIFSLALLGDLIFYGSFLRGVAYLIEGFVL